MAFWKKSDDPWDRKPGRRPPPPAWEEPGDEEPAQPPLTERLKRRFKPAEEPPGPPETCPWCGGEMERGYLRGGQGLIYWSRKKPGFVLGVGPEGVLLDDEGAFGRSYKTAWYCEKCQKLTVDMAGAGEPSEAVKKTMWPPPEEPAAED